MPLKHIQHGNWFRGWCSCLPIKTAFNLITKGTFTLYCSTYYNIYRKGKFCSRYLQVSTSKYGQGNILPSSWLNCRLNPLLNAERPLLQWFSKTQFKKSYFWNQQLCQVNPNECDKKVASTQIRNMRVNRDMAMWRQQKNWKCQPKPLPRPFVLHDLLPPTFMTLSIIPFQLNWSTYLGSDINLLMVLKPKGDWLVVWCFCLWYYVTVTLQVLHSIRAHAQILHCATSVFLHLWKFCPMWESVLIRGAASESAHNCLALPHWRARRAGGWRWSSLSGRSGAVSRCIFIISRSPWTRRRRRTLTMPRQSEKRRTSTLRRLAGVSTSSKTEPVILHQVWKRSAIRVRNNWRSSATTSWGKRRRSLTRRQTRWGGGESEEWVFAGWQVEAAAAGSTPAWEEGGGGEAEIQGGRGIDKVFISVPG